MEREISLLIGDDDDLKSGNINIDNENSNLSSFSTLMINNLFNTSGIISENNVNQINPSGESEDKGSSNNMNNTANNNLPSFSQMFNGINQDNNNLFHFRKFSISSLNDKAFDNYDKNFSKNTITNNNINNNINNNNININNNINTSNNINNNINNNNNFYGGNWKNMIDNNIVYNNNQSYDFYSNSHNMYNFNLNFQNNRTFNHNCFNKTFIDYRIPFNYNNNNYKNFNNQNNQNKKNIFKKRKNFRNSNDNNFNSKKNFNIQSNNTNSLSNFNNNFKKLYDNDKIMNKNKINNNINNDKVISMIKDQNKNKYIQKKIEEKSPKFLYNLYQQMKSHLYEIINDQYGNYVIQKYMDYCDKKILSAILKQLYKYNEKSIYETSINPYGTRALQKLLEKISNYIKEEDIEIIQTSIKGNITSMIKNINGNHVIQSIIENIKNKEFLSFMYKEISQNQNLIEILTIKSGYCVFLKIINNFSNEDVNNIFEIILKNIDKLINDEFGNFIIQKVITINNKNYNNKIYNYIKDKIVQLSTQKFSSNVIECCIADSSTIKNKVIQKIIDENNVKALIIDKFGNYIIQKALTYFKDNEEIFFTIISNIKKNINILKHGDELGQKIYNKLMKNYGQYLDANNGKNKVHK